MSDRPERRLLALKAALFQVDAAINSVRVAVHELAQAETPGSVDVTVHALYELIRAGETLEAQAREFHREHLS